MDDDEINALASVLDQTLADMETLSDESFAYILAEAGMITMAPGYERLLAHLIRQYVPEDGKPFHREAKLFWLAVAEHIGPDYSRGIKTVGDFLKRFGDFS